MSVQPRGYGLNGKSLYTNVTKPMYSWLTFTVTPTNGLGVTSVKSNGYANYVFMHTSTTPTASNGITNPNPPAGFAVIGLTNSFNYFLGLRGAIDAPATSTSTTSTTINVVYTITSVGTTTLAQWQAVGLPTWLTPTVGQTFVATASQAIGGSGTVGTAGITNISGISVVGDPNQTIASPTISTSGGAYLVVQFSALTASGTISAPTFTGESYTPAGTVAAPVLSMNSYTPAGTNDGASPPIFTGTPATLTGTNSAPAFTGTAHTLAGTVSAPTFTSTSAAAAAAPTTGSVVRLELCYDGSTVTIDGL